MFSPSRDEARRFFFDSWRKFRQKEILSGQEDAAVRAILAHPEYHPLLENWNVSGDRDYLPESGETNPFLHLSLHLAVDEQLSIDQPPGVQAGYRRLLGRVGSEHEARHGMMECLAEILWQAQQDATAPDGNRYLECLERRGSAP